MVSANLALVMAPSAMWARSTVIEPNSAAMADRSWTESLFAMTLRGAMVSAWTVRSASTAPPWGGAPGSGFGPDVRWSVTSSPGWAVSGTAAAASAWSQAAVSRAAWNAPRACAAPMPVTVQVVERGVPAAPGVTATVSGPGAATNQEASNWPGPSVATKRFRPPSLAKTMPPRQSPSTARARRPPA